MKTNLLKQGILTENSTGISTVTRKMVRQRAVELAVMDGRSAQNVSKADWEQAKRELSSASDMDPKEVIGAARPVSEQRKIEAHPQTPRHPWKQLNSTKEF